MILPPRLLPCCLALLCCLLGNRLWAHRVNVFASVAADGVVAGQVYFSGGGRPAGATVLLLADEVEHARTTTDTDGRFRFAAVEPGTYEVVVELADGHRASCRIEADEFGGHTPATASTGHQAPSGDPAAAPATGRAPDPDAPERLVAQVRALRADIHALDKRIRLQDVLGGLGYILGLTGLWCLLRRHRG